MKAPEIRFTLAAAAAGLLLATHMSGCVGYKLGSNLPAGIRTVAVPVFANETGEPGLEAIATSAAIQEVQKDGSLKIAPREQANCLLEVRLKQYKLNPVRYRRDQATTAREYRLDLTADYVLRKLPGNEVIAQGTGINGFTNFEALADLPSARRAAFPKAAADLAHRIVREVTEYW